MYRHNSIAISPLFTLRSSNAFCKMGRKSLILGKFSELLLLYIRKHTFVSLIEVENNFDCLEIEENSFDSSDFRKTPFDIVKVILVENGFDSLGKTRHDVCLCGEGLEFNTRIRSSF